MRIDHEPRGLAKGWEKHGFGATGPGASPGAAGPAAEPGSSPPAGSPVPDPVPPAATSPAATPPASTAAVATTPAATSTAPGATTPVASSPAPADPDAAEALASVSSALAQVVEANSALSELLANRPTFNTTFSGTLSHPVGRTATQASTASRSPLDPALLASLRNAPDAATAQAGLEAVLGALGFGLTGSERAAFGAIQDLQRPLLGTPFDYRTFL